MQCGTDQLAETVQYEHVGGWVIGWLCDWPPVVRQCRAQSNGLISDHQYGAMCLLNGNAVETRLHAGTH